MTEKYRRIDIEQYRNGELIDSYFDYLQEAQPLNDPFGLKKSGGHDDCFIARAAIGERTRVWSLKWSSDRIEIEATYLNEDGLHLFVPILPDGTRAGIYHRVLDDECKVIHYFPSIGQVGNVRWYQPPDGIPRQEILTGTVVGRDYMRDTFVVRVDDSVGRWVNVTDEVFE